MFVGITNTPRDYAWGSTSAIAELTGSQPSGGPEAELWFGAHPLSPSRIVDPAAVGGHETLDGLIAADPARALGAARRSDTLPFLLKLLAADVPLSLQAHPSIEQAKEGFAREHAAGIPLDADARLYKDELHKPELTLALSDAFEALAGFRDVAGTRLLLQELVDYATASRDEDAELLGELRDRSLGEPVAALAHIVQFALSGTPTVPRLIEAVVRNAARAPKSSSFLREYATVGRLAELHPGDPGVLVALLLNRVTLTQGQALYLPSGNIHSYQHGLALEIMAASDNVLRGGLTPKHVDGAELQKVLDFVPVPPPVIRPEEESPGVEVFRPDVPDFLLARVTVGDAGARDGYALTGVPEATWTPPGASIALALGGAVTIAGAVSTGVLEAGSAAFITADEGALRFSGSATVFVASGV
ncbi:MAG TPA: mannose-6-phosphate isomerase, class I [Naasia sp.]|jgi:mannose-6-phosphate isomerase